MAFFRDYVLHNFGLKVFSLIIAVLLWATVAQERTAEVVMRVPIVFHNVPEKLEISSERVPDAEVRVRGPEATVRQLAPAEIHVVVDLNNAPAGEHTYNLNPAGVNVPRNLDVVQVVPSQFRVSLDQLANRQVEIHPRVTGQLASGYHILDVTTTPKAVTVVGPARHVKEVDAAITDPINAAGILGSVTFTARPYVTDPLVRVVTPETVRVTIVTGKTK